MRLFEKQVIRGCEGRGDADSAYMTRLRIFQCDLFGMYFHKFHRSDADDLHDHPWTFASLILWRGYREISSYRGACRTMRALPGMVLIRPAEWAHRVELIDGKPAYTLVFRLRKRRTWGFYTPTGWQRWMDYFRSLGC